MFLRPRPRSVSLLAVIDAPLGLVLAVFGIKAFLSGQPGGLESLLAGIIGILIVLGARALWLMRPWAIGLAALANGLLLALEIFNLFAGRPIGLLGLLGTAAGLLYLFLIRSRLAPIGPPVLGQFRGGPASRRHEGGWALELPSTPKSVGKPVNPAVSAAAKADAPAKTTPLETERPPGGRREEAPTF